MDTPDRSTLLAYAVEIAAAYLAANKLPPGEIEPLMREIYGALARLGDGAAEAAEPAQPKPAVPVRKSVFPDYIVCLEDGKKLKTLKRYLRARFNMTPEEYRAKWQLPADYPMVAPSLAAARSAIARETGLGVKERPRPALKAVAG